MPNLESISGKSEINLENMPRNAILIGKEIEPRSLINELNTNLFLFPSTNVYLKNKKRSFKKTSRDIITTFKEKT